MLGHGTVITFDTGFFAEVLSIQHSGIERPAVPTTHFGTTGGKTFVPSDTYDGGELVVELHHANTAQPPILSAAETVTITWPDTIENYSFSGFMSGYEINVQDEEKVRATARLKVAGTITW